MSRCTVTIATLFLLVALLLIPVPARGIAAGSAKVPDGKTTCTGKARSTRACKASKPKPTLAKGMKVNIGGYRLWIQCIGKGSPTVVFDSGLDSDSSYWFPIEHASKSISRVCIYDRANRGASDRRPGKSPATAATVVKELHTLLR